MYHRAVSVSAYTAPGGIVMIRLDCEAEYDASEIVEDSAGCVDLDADGNVIAIEIIDRPAFNLPAVAAAYGIEELIPAIEAAIAAAKPGP